MKFLAATAQNFQEPSTIVHFFRQKYSHATLALTLQSSKNGLLCVIAIT